MINAASEFDGACSASTHAHRCARQLVVIIFRGARAKSPCTQGSWLSLHPAISLQAHPHHQGICPSTIAFLVTMMHGVFISSIKLRQLRCGILMTSLSDTPQMDLQCFLALGSQSTHSNGLAAFLAVESILLQPLQVRNTGAIHG